MSGGPRSADRKGTKFTFSFNERKSIEEQVIRRSIGLERVAVAEDALRALRHLMGDYTRAESRDLGEDGQLTGSRNIANESI